MSAAADATYSLLGIINTVDVLRKYHQAHPDAPFPVAIMYRPQQSGRGYQCAAWQVYGGPGVKTTDDAKPHWLDHGLKTFNCFDPRQMKEPQLAAAQAWAGERYGVAAWKKLGKIRTPGDWVPAEVVDWFEVTRREAARAARLLPS